MERIARCSMLAVAAVLAVHASSPAGAADGKLVIGSLDELTGSMSSVGPAMQKANTLAVAEANKAAEAAGLGWTVELASADTQGDPQAALSAARQLVDKGASCMIGPATTPESLAIANGLTIRQKIVLMPTGTSMRMRTVDDQGTIIRVAAGLAAGQCLWPKRQRRGSTARRARPCRSATATSPTAKVWPGTSPRPGRPRAAW